ncbi:hypothetical protein EB796_012941 [Bugula neritina]|uniref:Uncharacterized protein n=1 Tax=Bugula neritina TaxID=10212 RepID=A0A7J7JQW6_BUGNE|nr:hypothetical protein EB796_012941 [Bugula neritina]
MTPTNEEDYTDTPTQRRVQNSHFELLLTNIDFDLLCNRTVLSADPKHLPFGIWLRLESHRSPAVYLCATRKDTAS